MRAPVLSLLLLATAAAAPDELTFAKKPYVVQKLEFQLSIPNGWEAQHNHIGMVARNKDEAGFIVSREPFLHDPKTYAKVWQAELEKADKTAKVKATKAGRYGAWRAAWTADAAGGRAIEVWRVHAPSNEMLYNISFSAKAAADLEPLVEGVLRSFKVTAQRPTMEFQKEEVSLAARISFRAPVGYVEQERGVRLGGGLARGFHRTLPGYTPPHLSGEIAISGARGQTKNAVTDPWITEQVNYGKVLKKQRTRAVKYAGIKGHKLTATVLTKEGTPKRYLVFAGNLKGSLIIVRVVVDVREARLHRDYLKAVCSQIIMQ